MNFAGEKFMIPFPSLLFYLVSTNGNLISSRCFALKEPVLEKVNTSSILYAFPFGNVMPADAHICWGSIQLPPILNYQDLKTVIEIFSQPKAIWIMYIRKAVLKVFQIIHIF